MRLALFTDSCKWTLTSGGEKFPNRLVELFDAVFEQAIGEMESEVPFDPDDLPGYAARLVRLHERRPEIMRLCTWQRLERTESEPNPAGVAFARGQIDAIATPSAANPPHSADSTIPGVVSRALDAFRRGWEAEFGDGALTAPPPGRLSVSELTAHWQFSDSRHFIPALKKRHGRTPTEYARSTWSARS